MGKFEKLGALAAPILKAGALFTWEMVRGLVLALVVCVSIGLWVMPTLLETISGYTGAAHTGSAGALLGLLTICLRPGGFVLLLLAVVFPVCYVLVVQKRAISRAANTLFKAHGEALYDRTLGHFVSQQLDKEPGMLAKLVVQPNVFVKRLKDYLEQTEKLPKFVRRIAQHYATSLLESTNFKGLVQEGKVLDAAAVRAQALAYANDAAAPSWKPFQILVAAHFAVALGAWLWFK